MSCRGQRKGLGTGADPSQHCLIIVVLSVVVMSLKVVTRRHNRHVLSRMIAVLLGSNSRKSSIRTESFTRQKTLGCSAVFMEASHSDRNWMVVLNHGSSM